MVSRNTRSTSAARISPLPAQLQPSTPAHLALSPNSEASDGSPGFLYTLFGVLGDVTLEPWIHWHKDEGLFIPNVVEFVKRVLCIHFPGMKGGWKSFQKQMSNYGFVKRDRNSKQAHYVHWENKFRKGSPELLPEVQPRPKGSTSTFQNTVQVDPLPPNTPAVPEPLGQPNLGDVVEALEKRVAELEGRLEVAEGQISRRLDTALAQFWAILCQMVPIMIWDTIGFAFRALFGFQIPNHTSSTPHYSAGMSVAQTPPMIQGGLTNDPGPSSIPGIGQQQNAGPSAGTQTSSSNDFVSSSTSQGRIRTQNSNSAMASNGPAAPVSLVPQRSAPGSGPRASGPTNSGH